MIKQVIVAGDLEFRKGEMVSVVVKGIVFTGMYDGWDPEYGFHRVKFPTAGSTGKVSLVSIGFPKNKVTHRV